MQNTARPPECVHVVAAAPACEGLAAVYRDSMIVRPDFDAGDVLSYSCRELLAKVVWSMSVASSYVRYGRRSGAAFSH